MAKEIQFIITGGTIDKSYHPQTGELYFESTIIPDLVNQCRYQGHITFCSPFLVDSLDMNSVQRNQILELCKNSPSSNITITHGTDTLIETAQALSDLKLSKTIILTGAMIPARVSNSDAIANISQSLTGHNTLSYGVFIGFQGQFFSPDQCFKNKEKSIFETQ